MFISSAKHTLSPSAGASHFSTSTTHPLPTFKLVGFIIPKTYSIRCVCVTSNIAKSHKAIICHGDFVYIYAVLRVKTNINKHNREKMKLNTKIEN